MLEDIKKELLNIANMESDEKETGWRKRNKAMSEFIDKHFIVVEKEISVINSKNFNSDIMDLVKEKLCEQIAEDLTTYTKYDIMKNKVKARLVALKR